VYVSNFGSNTIAVYDIDIGKLIWSLPVAVIPMGLALSRVKTICWCWTHNPGDVRSFKAQSHQAGPTEYSRLTMIPVACNPIILW